MRLTILYAGLFLASGTVLIAITSALAATDNPPLQEYRYGPASGSAPGTSITVPGLIQQTMASEYAQQVQQHAAVQHELLLQSLIALAIMSVLSIGLGWLVAGRFLRPLRTITATARRVSAISLDERLALAGPDDELKELADTFDGLLSRLEQSFEAQRRFVANASHELRTPVTRQRAMAEVALGDPSPTVESLRATCTGVVDASIQQERLIEALLTLARGQRGLGKRAPADLADIAERVTHARLPDAHSRGLTIETSFAAALFYGDERLAERLVANLVDNAVLHNIPGGSVRVSTRTPRRGGAALSVTNSGAVIPPAEVSGLFEPFRRLGTERTGNRNGTGLGLSIVDAIATAHDAVLRARALPAGGLEIRVHFPSVEPPSAGQLPAVQEETRPSPTDTSVTRQSKSGSVARFRSCPGPDRR
jgi:signal transduction histidine kinase